MTTIFITPYLNCLKRIIAIQLLTRRTVCRKGANETPFDASQRHLRKPQEFFDPKLYPSIFKIFEREYPKVQDEATSFAEFTAQNPPLKERWLENKHPDMELEEAELVLDLLQGLLTYDPKQRLTTKAVLQHPWIQKYCESGEFDAQAATIATKRKGSESEENQREDGTKKRKRSKSEENEREDETKDTI